MPNKRVANEMSLFNSVKSCRINVKDHDNQSKKTAQYLHNKSTSCERFCNVKKNVKKRSVTRNKRDINMRNKHVINGGLVTQYKHDKGKASQIDGILNIRGHIPMILGRNYEVNSNGQPKAKVANIKGG